MAARYWHSYYFYYRYYYYYEDPKSSRATARRYILVAVLFLLHVVIILLTAVPGSIYQVWHEAGWRGAMQGVCGEQQQTIGNSFDERCDNKIVRTPYFVNIYLGRSEEYRHTHS